MGKMKELFIEKMNEQIVDDTDWNYNITPDEYDETTGNYMWTVEGYRIWAKTFKEAVELLPLIKSF